MKFEELDRKMRVFETANDRIVLPEIYTVARVDGRGFTRLTKGVHHFESPYDERFRNLMAETVRHLMNCGFDILYAYTQSDEISLLFSLEDNTFARKHRKINSVLAGEASAKFSLLLGDLASFDCRVSELPNRALVIDYFRWRHEDAHRNALNAHCYWGLRKEGMSATQAAASLSGKKVSEKNELLYRLGVNFNDLPNWQKRGVGLYWETYEKPAEDPRTGTPVMALRRRIKVDYELPMKDRYSEFIASLLPD